MPVECIGKPKMTLSFNVVYHGVKGKITIEVQYNGKKYCLEIRKGIVTKIECHLMNKKYIRVNGTSQLWNFRLFSRKEKMIRKHTGIMGNAEIKNFNLKTIEEYNSLTGELIYVREISSGIRFRALRFDWIGVVVSHQRSNWL